MANYGLRDTVRLRVKDGAEVTLQEVVVDLLQDILNIQVSEILCLQDFPSQGIYDVTFTSSEICWHVYEGLRARSEDKVVKKFKSFPMFQKEDKVITVHLYNPFADISLVRAFLLTYCDELRGGEKVKNKYGIWSGKYRFVARLKDDPSCIGGVKRPPAVFTVGGERGFLFYSGQPMYCRNCLKYGHTKAECTLGMRCRFCGGEHQAAQCRASRVCDICQKSGHLARQCETYTNVKKAYAFADMMNNRDKAGGQKEQATTSQGKGGASSGSSDTVGPAGKPEVPKNVSSEPSKDVDEARVEQEADRATSAEGVVVGGTAPPIVDTEQGVGQTGEDGMDTDITTDQDAVVGGCGTDAASVPLPGPLSGLSSSEAEDEDEESEEEDEEEMDEESGSLACGQGVVRSTGEDEELSSKRFRGEGGGEESGNLIIPTHGGSELAPDSAGSPMDVRRYFNARDQRP